METCRVQGCGVTPPSSCTAAPSSKLYVRERKRFHGRNALIPRLANEHGVPNSTSPCQTAVIPTLDDRPSWFEPCIAEQHAQREQFCLPKPGFGCQLNCNRTTRERPAQRATPWCRPRRRCESGAPAGAPPDSWPSRWEPARWSGAGSGGGPAGHRQSR